MKFKTVADYFGIEKSDAINLHRIRTRVIPELITLWQRKLLTTLFVLVLSTKDKEAQNGYLKAFEDGKPHSFNLKMCPCGSNAEPIHELGVFTCPDCGEVIE